MIGRPATTALLNQKGGDAALALKQNYEDCVDINTWLLGHPVDNVQAIASITRSGQVATVTTAAPHGYSTGDWRTIAGAAQAEYNGTKEITVVDATHFTFNVTGSPATPATGTVTVGIDPLVTSAFGNPMTGMDADTYRAAMADLAYGKTQSFDSSQSVKKLWGLGS